MFVSEQYISEFLNRIKSGLSNIRKTWQAPTKMNDIIRKKRMASSQVNQKGILSKTVDRLTGQARIRDEQIKRLQMARNKAYVDKAKLIGKGTVAAGGVGLVGKSYNDARRESQQQDNQLY